ncbi:MAG: isopentenyl-diphosphate Delta-isomerase [Bacteroidota bacterium]|nr:isopentenyl-diphosphate Delta-isomerase [Bacteroidota bacterium]
MEEVVLVDRWDKEIGTMEKMEAHKKGILHRAFSVLLFDQSGKMLLQKRSKNKYHSGGLWTNACCSHPLPGEKIESATRRRLQEEMGIDIQPTFSHTFIYKAALGDDLVEHELDHVFVGTFSGNPAINKTEVEDWKYVDIEWLKRDMATHPDSYTVWFKLIVNQPELMRE